MAALFDSGFQDRNNRMENSNPQTLVELLKRAVAARPQTEALRFKQEKKWTGLTAEQLL